MSRSQNVNLSLRKISHLLIFSISLYSKTKIVCSGMLGFPDEVDPRKTHHCHQHPPSGNLSSKRRQETLKKKKRWDITTHFSITQSDKTQHNILKMSMHVQHIGQLCWHNGSAPHLHPKIQCILCIVVRQIPCLIWVCSCLSGILFRFFAILSF